MKIQEHNRLAWDAQVTRGNEWTIPVSDAEVEAARRGEWRIFLTPTKPVPAAWFPPLPGAKVLCLASGGGQQGPVLAAAGAEVTVFDNSPRQLAQDAQIAQRHRLGIQTVLGDMADLSVFPDESFALIVHPVSNTFVPAVRPVWQEAHRVLQTGGVLLAGFDNPICHMLDWDAYERGEMVIRYPLPYSDAASLSEDEKRRRLEVGWALEFGHTLEDQIGGQLDAGFHLTGFYEDINNKKGRGLLDRYCSQYIATRAVR